MSVGPPAGRVNDLAGPDPEGVPRFEVFDRDPDDAITFAQEPGDPGAADAQRTKTGSGARKHHGVPGIVNLPFIKLDRAADG